MHRISKIWYCKHDQNVLNKKNEDTCIGCKKCDKACPMNIGVSIHEQVRNGQCINCFECINACPVEGTLKYTKVKLPIGKKNK